ncbi:MAG: DUF1801 domain-containing protein [Acidimicrobiales bacterium]|nr:DUF1801 domain-containing protein [Acidimicrobiales bacterium]
MTETRYGTFAELLADTNLEMRPVAAALRELILDVHPEAVEVVRLGDRAATFGVGPKKMSEAHSYVLPYDNWVNLGFFWGANLDDPDSRLEGTGANMRHVKVRTLDEAADPTLRALIQEALADRQAAAGSTNGA